MLNTCWISTLSSTQSKIARNRPEKPSTNALDKFASRSHLVYGAVHSAYPERNLADIEGLAARLEIMPFNGQAGTNFGQVRAELYRIGKPIGPYDMMIAGHARALGLILVTNNVK